MGATNSMKNDLLKLAFHGIGAATAWDNAAASPATTWQASLHTALPTTHASFLAAYTGYVDASIVRSALGWDLDETTHEITNLDEITWPIGVDVSPVEYSHVGLSLSGVLRFTVEMPDPIVVAAGIQPKVIGRVGVTPGKLVVRAV